MRNIVLASASPRRRELLSQLKLPFEVDVSGLEEKAPPGMGPHHLVRELSLHKAQAVAARHGNAVIIAADTIGLIGGIILGKPRSEEEARQMLKSISGRRHRVITGFTILDTMSGHSLSRSVETIVHIRRLTPAGISAYVRTGEPLDKAGGYAIQGVGAVIVEGIEGDYSNVVGLPLAALAASLKEFGVNVL
jgi:septum formation protein